MTKGAVARASSSAPHDYAAIATPVTFPQMVKAWLRADCPHRSIREGAGYTIAAADRGAVLSEYPAAMRSRLMAAPSL
jgi:hypothetical protein